MTAHGLFGPQIAGANLGTVLLWVHYRGILALFLLAAGNFFCTACPMVLVRDIGRRFHAPNRSWPRWLRTNWPAVVLFAAIIVSYEVFSLWSAPTGTALLIIVYFAAALAVDTVFTGATFCKYLCPIGQFNFVASALSPLELRVRSIDICRTCRTVDCIKGRRAPGSPSTTLQRGCELRLFLPSKVGNMDCTFCLDCVQACPHGNVGLLGRLPAEELTDERRRSGIGRLSARPDIAATATLFTFGALMNAFAMVTPAARVESWLAGVVGLSGRALSLSVLFLLGLVVLPACVLAVGAALTDLPSPTSIYAKAMSFVYALVPFGFGVWLAHYSFHFLTGVLTAVPVTQSAAFELFGWPALGTPRWRWTGMHPGAVYPIQLGLLVLGTLGSVATVARIAQREHPGRPIRAAWPWTVMIVLLASAAIWIMSQPMDMRGVSLSG